MCNLTMYMECLLNISDGDLDKFLDTGNGYKMEIFDKRSKS